MGGYVGGSGPEDVARLRRMTAEPTTAVYSDAALQAAIERYPVADRDDIYPDEAGWLPSYDLAMAAAEVWAEKATVVAANFDFDADGASYKRSQQYEHYVKQARRWRSLRVPGNWTAVPAEPETDSVSVVGNVNNPYA